MATPISIRGLAKEFPGAGRRAVDGVDLEVAAGELFFLLGPSGCGKSTLLRMIAGLVEPTEGTVRFGDRDVTHEPASRRRVGMVFQSYALWPHMTVGGNVGFGLDVRRVRGRARAERVERALAMVRMERERDRKPGELSGGEQQRVALARALVVEPEVLLLDEPLSNLDARLRIDLRAEIRRVCKASGTTTIYVTHDQKEALSMADRVAIMHRGRVVQMGEPRELYRRPATRFAAEFLGETNFLEGEVVEAGEGTAIVRTAVGDLRARSVAARAGERVLCSVRPESWRLVPRGERGAIAGRVAERTYLGEMEQLAVDVGGSRPIRVVVLSVGGVGVVREDDDLVGLRADPEDVVVVPTE